MSPIENVPVSERNPLFDINKDTKVKEEATAEETQRQNSDDILDVNELLKNDPAYKKLYDKMVGNYAQQSSASLNIMSRVMNALMELNQVLSRVATIYADHLGKITEKLNAYSKLQTQIPVITDGMGFMDDTGDSTKDEKIREDRGQINQKFGNMLEAIRANKGIEEDKAKKLNTILQAMKDAGQQASDFMTSFADMWRQVGSKISQ